VEVVTPGKTDIVIEPARQARPTSALQLASRVTASFLGVASVLFVNGAVPFLGLPTLGSGVWLSGFAQSIANGDALSVYAVNFGIPGAAAISYGLSIAYPMGLLIKLGLHPADAYSLIAAIWLSLAFYGAWSICLRFASGRHYIGILGAVFWCTTPLVWVHAGFTALSIGIALLPFYFSTLLCLYAQVQANGLKLRPTLGYVAACIVAVFMDGYTFVMFSAGGALLGLYFLFRFAENRIALLFYALPTQFIGLGLAYSLYALYTKKLYFEPSPIDFFRGWGLDLSFLVVPSQGVHWLWDSLGLSIARSASDWFGAPPVWTATFSAPAIVAGLIVWWLLGRRSVYGNGFFIIALFGAYMALGPSLKINSKKPASMVEADSSVQLMPADMALAPTGSAWLSENVPGFQNMRAAYRWLALGFLGFWLLIVLGIGRLEFFQAHRSRAVILLFALTLSNLPHPVERWRSYAANRAGLEKIDSELVSDFGKVLRPGEKVAFLPFRNDFLVNYIAARLEIHTYNIGGDKNLQEARRRWPAVMRQFQMGQVDGEFADRVLLLLSRREADAVVLPYIDMLWAAHSWPADAIHKDEIEPVLAELAAFPMVAVQEREHYAIVRIAKEFESELRSGALERRVAAGRCLPPRCLEIEAAKLAELPSRVGSVKQGRFISDGRRGFLLFGPYAPMESGNYRLLVFGGAQAPGSSWTDVVSDRGRTVHARFALADPPPNASDALLAGRVKLNSPVNDLEVRIFVDEDARIQIEGYRLEPFERGEEPRTETPPDHGN
jgi:hypothetical protein